MQSRRIVEKIWTGGKKLRPFSYERGASYEAMKQGGGETKTKGDLLGVLRLK